MEEDTFPVKLNILTVPSYSLLLVLGTQRLQVNFSSIFNDAWEKVERKTQPTIKCSKLTIETLEQDLKYVQSQQ